MGTHEVFKMAEDRQEGGGKKSNKKDKMKERKFSENGPDDEPDFSDPEDFEDDIEDEDLVGDILKKKPKETDGIDSVIVVDNVPQVEASGTKLPKLQNVISKIFGKFGKLINEHYPAHEGGKTKGYIFLEYSNSSEAQEAVKMTDGYKLDKQHTFVVNLFTDFDKYSEEALQKWEEPSAKEYKDHGNLQNWLLESHCYDQYSVIYESGARTAIYTNTHQEPTQVEERGGWTETYVRWSPKGTYLATFHARGIALWGGEKFKQIQRFSHQGVHFIDFSPCEKYMVTFSPQTSDTREDPKAIIIWDILTGQAKRSFHCDNASSWPIFKWSADGKYFARMTKEVLKTKDETKVKDLLSVYETPSFGLLDKKSIPIDGLNDFAWSPTDNIIAYWTPEYKEIPARVTLIRLPSREVVCTKNLFTVADCKLHWQKSGDFLCVKVDRYKSKKVDDGVVKYCGVFHNFNIFRMREKQIPVDVVEVKETIIAFAWEPIGRKFAIIHGENPRISASFYKVEEKVECMKTLDKRTCNALFWSPRGQFLVLAGLGSMAGELEFIDTADMTTMAKTDHFQATDVEWDPTGRYVCTGVSFWGCKVDNGYWIWSFQGKPIHKQPLPQFCQLLWRPRPATLLTDEAIKKIKKNIRSYYPTFQLEDKMRESKASKEQIEKRQELLADFEEWRAELDYFYEDEKETRLELRRGIDTDEIDNDTENFEEEVIEFLLSVEETLIENE